MLGVRHDHRPIGELDLVAGAAIHDLGRGHHPSRLPVGADQMVTDADLAHRRPTGRCGQRGVGLQCFPHTRSRRDHDHLPRVQAVGHLIQFGEPGRHASCHSALGGDRVDLVHRRLQQRLQRLEVLGGAPLGDVVDLRLGAVDDLVDVSALRPGVAVLHHPRAGLHQPAQQRLLRDDARVIAGIGGGGHRGDQGVQIRGAADAAQQAAAVQFGGDGDRVGRLTTAVEVEDRVIDVLVGGPVEVARAQALQDVGDRVLAQQHPAQHGLLGDEILRGLAGEVLGRNGRRRSRLTEVIDDRHLVRPPPSASDRT